jgi:hypothetical protein
MRQDTDDLAGGHAREGEPSRERKGGVDNLADNRRGVRACPAGASPAPERRAGDVFEEEAEAAVLGMKSPEAAMRAVVARVTPMLPK